MKEPKDMTMNEIIYMRQTLSNSNTIIKELILSCGKAHTKLTGDLICLRKYGSDDIVECENRLLKIDTTFKYAKRTHSKLLLLEESLADCESLRRRLNSIYSNIHTNTHNSETYITNSDFTFDVVEFFDARDEFLEANKKYKRLIAEYNEIYADKEYRTIPCYDILKEASEGPIYGITEKAANKLNDAYDSLKEFYKQLKENRGKN